MSKFWDIRCHNPDSYKPGACEHLLFRFSSTGGIEIKCPRCREVVMIHRTKHLEPRLGASYG